MHRLKSVDEIMRETRARIDAIFTILEFGGDVAEERAQRRAQEALDPDLIDLEEDVDFMRFDMDPYNCPDQQPIGTTVARGLPINRRRPTKEEENEYVERCERNYQDLKARGFIPRGMELPETPEEVPDWALEEPSSPVGPAPKWPHDFYGTGGRLPCPWPERHEVIMENFDPLYIQPGNQPPPMSYAPAQLVEDPVDNTSLQPNFAEVSSPFFTRVQGNPPPQINPPPPRSPLPQRIPSPPRNPSPPRSPLQQRTTSQRPLIRAQSPGPQFQDNSLADDLLPDEAFNQVADDFFMTGPPPQAQPPVMPRPVGRPASRRPAPVSHTPRFGGLPDNSLADDLLPDEAFNQVADDLFMTGPPPQAQPPVMPRPVGRPASRRPAPVSHTPRFGGLPDNSLADDLLPDEAFNQVADDFFMTGPPPQAQPSVMPRPVGRPASRRPAPASRTQRPGGPPGMPRPVGRPASRRPASASRTSRPGGLPDNSLADDLLPLEAFNQVADDLFMTGPPPQAQPPAMPRPVGRPASRRPAPVSHAPRFGGLPDNSLADDLLPDEAFNQVADDLFMTGPPPQAQDTARLVGEVSDIIRETRARLDRALNRK